jgi:hypothetical protein
VGVGLYVAAEDVDEAPQADARGTAGMMPGCRRRIVRETSGCGSDGRGFYDAMGSGRSQKLQSAFATPSELTMAPASLRRDSLRVQEPRVVMAAFAAGRFGQPSPLEP